MDVKTKMKLSQEMESYWEMLPWHIVSKIIDLEISKEYLDELESQKREKLCRQIRKLHELKVEWGLGPVVCKPLRCKHSVNNYGFEHMKLYGRYVNLIGEHREAFLAFNFDRALMRCQHLKSFICYRTDKPNGLCYSMRDGLCDALLDYDGASSQ